MNRTTTVWIGIGFLVAGAVVSAAAGTARADDGPGGADLVAMEKSLRAPDAACQASRRELITLIEKQCLADPAATRAVTPAQWKDLAEGLSRDLGPQGRQTWLAAIRAAFAAKPSDLQTRRAGEALAVASACFALRDPQAAALLDELEPMWAGGGVDWENCGLVARAWSDRDGPKARQWALRACTGLMNRKGDALKHARLVAMADLFADLGITGSFSEFTMMMTLLARSGQADAGRWDHCLTTSMELGGLLLGPECREPLLAELTDARGLVRAGVSEVLAWAYRLSGTAREWTAYLDKQVAATNGDAKAHWLMARAYAQTVIVCEGTDPFEGRSFINEALATAKSTPTRLYVARRIAMGYAWCVERAKGQAFLDSVAGQFAGDGEEGFARLQKGFDVMCARNERWLQRKRSAQEARQAALGRHWLTGRIEAARRAGDPKAAAELEKARAGTTPR